MKKLLLILFSVLLFSCSSEEENTKEVTKKSVFVLGNSITHSPPTGEWTGNWGMASTSPDKDFCGILSKKYELDRKNIATWENNFYCDESYYKFVTTKTYDYIVIKVGENVGDIDNFKTELQKLTEFYENYGKQIVLVTTVWKQYGYDSNNNPFEEPSDKDRIITEVAQENDYILVDISSMKEDNTMYAWDEYQDSGIGSHPNDKGMEFIAQKILEKL